MDARNRIAELENIKTESNGALTEKAAAEIDAESGPAIRGPDARSE